MQKSNQKKLLYCYIILLLVGVYFLCAPSASASLWDGMPNCQAKGDCTLNDFTRLAVNAAQIILGLTGSLALLAFIYGGVMFLISAGNQERVAQAKKILIGAVIGLIIVFTSFIIINFIMTGLGYSLPWYQVR